MFVGGVVLETKSMRVGRECCGFKKMRKVACEKTMGACRMGKLDDI